MSKLLATLSDGTMVYAGTVVYSMHHKRMVEVVRVWKDLNEDCTGYDDYFMLTDGNVRVNRCLGSEPPLEKNHEYSQSRI